MAGLAMSVPAAAAVPFRNSLLRMAFPSLALVVLMVGDLVLVDALARCCIEPVRGASIPCDRQSFAEGHRRSACQPDDERRFADAGIDQGVGAQILNGNDPCGHPGGRKPRRLGPYADSQCGGRAV